MAVMRKLKCKLTEIEVTQRGEKLAAKLGEKAELEREMKDEQARRKLVIAEVTKEIGQLAVEVHERAAERPVRCTWSKDSTRVWAELVRDDTGEIVESRPLTPEERQGALFVVGDDGGAGVGA